MGLLSGVLGNASEIEAGKARADFAPLLTPGERVEKAYPLILDSFVFTDKGLILTDVQGMTNGGHVQVMARQRSLKLGPRLQSGE